MTRQEALAEAMKLVDELAPRTNARGYTDGTIGPSERVTLVLKVADWLLANGGSLTTVANPFDALRCARCGRTDGGVIVELWPNTYGHHGVCPDD